MRAGCPFSHARATNQAQDGGRADRHTLTHRDASRHCSAGLEPELALFICQTHRAACGRSDNLGQGLGEGGAWTGRMATNETPDVQMQRHRYARPRQIGNGALIQGVDVF
jgi:hypothetical protein